MVARFREQYNSQVRAALTTEFGYKNALEVPRLEKIVINMGVGEGTQDAKKVDAALGDLAKITGQRPVKTKSTKSIAQFKLREGLAIGVKVTLRKHVMYEFLDRLIHIALPRNGSKTRIRNRCELTGRPRAVYRKFKLSRIALRELASTGQIPGMVKSSW